MPIVQVYATFCFLFYKIQLKVEVYLIFEKSE